MLIITKLSLSHRVGKNNLQLAVYSDRVVDPALTGVGEVQHGHGNVLPDLYSGTFTYQGNDLDARACGSWLQRKLTSNLTANTGLRLRRRAGSGQGEREPCRMLVAVDVVRNRHSVAAKISGTLPKSKTHWMASYRWINGQALTPVDMFNASAGRADPYLNLFFRQPIPGTGFLPGHMDAIDRCAQPAGAGIRSGPGAGWAHGLPGAIGARGSRRRSVHVLSQSSVVSRQPNQKHFEPCPQSDLPACHPDRQQDDPFCDHLVSVATCFPGWLWGALPALALIAFCSGNDAAASREVCAIKTQVPPLREIIRCCG